MTEAAAHESPAQPRRVPATVADVMRPPATTVDQNDHVAAAAYLMKHVGAGALVVLVGQESNRPIGIIAEADIVGTVADGKDVKPHCHRGRQPPWPARAHRAGVGPGPLRRPGGGLRLSTAGHRRP